jgi:tetratricopeptide (TPR) repeat protein
LNIEAAVLSHRANFFAAAERYEDALPAAEKALELNAQLGNTDAQATCLNTRAVVLSHLGRREEAIKAFDETIAMAPLGRSAVAKINRGSELLSLGRRQEALESITSGLRDAEMQGDPSNEGLARIHLGMWYLSSPDTTERNKGVEHLESARLLWRAQGDRRLLVKVLDSLQQLYVSVTQQQDSAVEQRIEAWRKLAAVRDELNEHAGVIEAGNALISLAGPDADSRLEGQIRCAYACVKLKQHANAIRHHQEAIQTLASIRAQGQPNAHLEAEMELYLSLGQAQRHLGQPQAALQSYQRSLQIAEQRQIPEAIWRANGNIGLIRSDLEEHDAAMSQLREVVDYYEKRSSDSDRQRMLAHATVNLAYAQQRAGNPVAKSTAEEAQRLLRLINDQDGLKALVETGLLSGLTVDNQA